MNENSRRLIRDSFEYYDKHSELYKKFYKKVKYYSDVIVNDGTTTHSEIVFYNEDKEEICRARCEIIGEFNKEHNIWAWAWSLLTIEDPQLINISQKIMQYGITLDTRQLFLKTELLTPRFLISHPMQLSLHVAISSYIAKKPVIFSIDHGSEKFPQGALRRPKVKNPKKTIYFYLLDVPENILLED